MARVRVPVTSPEDFVGIPAELRDWDSPAWADPVSFRRWIEANITRPVSGRQLDMLCESADYGARFLFAVDAWAIENGFGEDRSPKHPAWDRLELAGIRRMTPLERHRRRLIMQSGPTTE